MPLTLFLAQGVLAPELTGEFAAAGFIEVTNVISLEAVDFCISEAVDEYVLVKDLWFRRKVCR